MELRLAVEVEAAALAAERANRRQVAAIRTAWRGIERALHRGEGAVAEDFAFHRAIAEATGNGQFPRFLAFLGSHVIPRQSVRLSVDTPAERRAYLERIQHEHARIVDRHFRPAILPRRGAPCASISRARSSAIADWQKERKMADASARRIVFTGASGGIGTMIRPLLAPLYPGLVLSDKVEPKDLLPSRDRSSPPTSPSPTRWRPPSRAPTASSISAATRSKGRGTRSCRPTSSAATISSRRRARPA